MPWWNKEEYAGQQTLKNDLKYLQVCFTPVGKNGKRSLHLQTVIRKALMSHEVYQNQQLLLMITACKEDCISFVTIL